MLKSIDFYMILKLKKNNFEGAEPAKIVISLVRGVTF